MRRLTRVRLEWHGLTSLNGMAGTSLTMTTVRPVLVLLAALATFREGVDRCGVTGARGDYVGVACGRNAREPIVPLAA
jgi:hypothetical protein